MKPPNQRRTNNLSWGNQQGNSLGCARTCVIDDRGPKVFQPNLGSRRPPTRSVAPNPHHCPRHHVAGQGFQFTTEVLLQNYSFPNGPPGTARARARHGTARLGTGTAGTAACRAVPDSANVPWWWPRHGTIKHKPCRAVPTGPMALQCPCQPRHGHMFHKNTSSDSELSQQADYDI